MKPSFAPVFFYLLVLAFTLIAPSRLPAARPGGGIDLRLEDAKDPPKDSLTERGSRNFSDIGSWIWDTNVYDRQTVLFWNSFEIPEGRSVSKARLRITADNEYIMYLDGRELGRDAEWRHLYEYDITSLLEPGRHVIAVEAYNSSKEAGMVFGLRVLLEGGGILAVKSDSSWMIVPERFSGWEKALEPQETWRKATIICGLTNGPWGSPDYINLVPPMEPIVIPYWQTQYFHFMLMAACGALTFFSVILAAQLLLHKKEQRLLLGERSRIARDLHDDLGTRVTQLVLQGELAQRELPEGSRTREHLDRISEEAREALTAMDEILWAINPRRDTLHEFATFVCGQAQALLKNTPIQCVLDVEPAISTVGFDFPFRRSLLMAVKEALNNATKHSGATELLLQIRREGRGLTVSVQDNGRGFDLDAAKSGRNGLSNMTQRMRDVGGTCSIITSPEKGCRVEFHIPHIQMRQRSFWHGLRPLPKGFSRSKRPKLQSKLS